MQQHGPRPPSVPRPVRILSISRLGTATVRFLAGYVGIIEHWPGKRSRPCCGVAECPPQLHRATSVWKGFAPVEMWEASDQLWYPMVLEVTEALDELLYAQDLRGQVWALFADLTAKKRGPVQGLYLEASDLAVYPPAFDVRPVVLRTYHVPHIAWGAANPVPRRLALQPSAGSAPVDVFHAEPLPTERATKQQLDEFRKQRQAMGLGGRIGAARPTPHTNGKAGPHVS